MSILLFLFLFKMPNNSHYSKCYQVWRDSTVAMLFGRLVTLLMLSAFDVRYFESISSYFIQASYPEAHGRNIVNVTLVDFRAMDTLGEIFVLSIAALGGFSMLNLRAEGPRDA